MEGPGDEAQISVSGRRVGICIGAVVGPTSPPGVVGYRLVRSGLGRNVGRIVDSESECNCC